MGRQSLIYCVVLLISMIAVLSAPQSAAVRKANVERQIGAAATARTTTIAAQPNATTTKPKSSALPGTETVTAGTKMAFLDSPEYQNVLKKMESIKKGEESMSNLPKDTEPEDWSCVD